MKKKKNDLQAAMKQSLIEESNDFSAKSKKADSFFANLKKQNSESKHDGKDSTKEEKSEQVVNFTISMTKTELDDIFQIRKRYLAMDLEVFRSEIFRIEIHFCVRNAKE